jgi:hypothetical protein
MTSTTKMAIATTMILTIKTVNMSTRVTKCPGMGNVITMAEYAKDQDMETAVRDTAGGALHKVIAYL